jgi:hypothetical protein
MTLSFELTRIPGSEFLPRPEFMADRRDYPETDDGIWDVLGEYHPRIGTITLYEDRIMALAGELSSRPARLYPVLRELVRVHEHAHAYIHTAQIFNEGAPDNRPDRDWFAKLPKDMHESLAEYVVLCVLESNPRWSSWLPVFRDVDAGAPAHYKKWKQAMRLRRGLVFISPTVRFARTKVWKGWEEFYGALEARYRQITVEAMIFRMTG